MLSTVLAQAINLQPGQQFTNIGGLTFQRLVSALIIMILIIAALVFLFMLIWGGIRYITSGGDKGATETARGQITAALIGLVIVFAAWAIITLINTFFNVDILSLTIPNA